MWDESDYDLENKFAELRAKEDSLQAQLKQVRLYQTSINNLSMVQSSEIQDVVVNNVTVKQKVTTFSLPVNFAGNKIKPDYRDSQKVDLIINIDKFLGNTDV